VDSIRYAGCVNAGDSGKGFQVAKKWEQLAAEARRLSKFERGRLAAAITRSIAEPEEIQAAPEGLPGSDSDWS
jgi:hypothetical protein